MKDRNYTLSEKISISLYITMLLIYFMFTLRLVYFTDYLDQSLIMYTSIFGVYISILMFLTWGIGLIAVYHFYQRILRKLLYPLSSEEKILKSKISKLKDTQHNNNHRKIRLKIGILRIEYSLRELRKQLCKLKGGYE